MLTYCSGTDLEQLADHHLGELRKRPPKNPLSTETYVVQNHGMARWLSLYMAEKRGIAANLKFEFPAERIWSLIRAMDPDVPKALPSDRKPMTWAILYILKNDDDARLEVLQQYTEESDAARQEMRRWKLAGRIADVFDQYLTYRPEMILDWAKKNYKPKSATEQWQSVLWKKLIRHWESHSGKEYKHQAVLLNEILTTIDNKSLDTEKLPQRVTVFGVSAMPPVYLKILVKLSRLTDVYFYCIAPGKDQSSSNPINLSLGATGREYRDLLHKFIAEEEVETDRHFLNYDYNSAGESLLQIFKENLLDSENETASVGFDSTIQVHSCHSARREVEVLYDQLLAMFEKDETLQPSEVMVLAPDLEAYAPEIEAIFGTVEDELPEIPFHLAERNRGRSNPVDLAVEKIIELADSRFKVTEVLDLLDSEPIQQKFNFTDDSLITLERWIDDNNIRWGIDAKSKEALDLPGSNSFTWKAGLNRMILGYAMKPDEDHLFNGIYPYREVEQTEEALLVGRFANLMELLFRLHKEVQTSRSIAQWSTLLNEWIFKFFPQKDDYFSELQRIRDMFSNLDEYKQLSGFEDDVPFRIIRSYVQEELEKKITGSGRSGKGITFSSMVPMRNIPAKVICVLGLNDNSFPRSKLPVAFDMLHQAPRPGDRSHRKEDRQLFLEILLAAKERVYFSYIGQSNRQDSKFPPSVVLRELIDYLTDRYSLKEKEMVTEHSLQAFSPKYFKAEHSSPLFSYSQRNLDIAKRLINSESEYTGFLIDELPDPDPDYKRLTVNSLIHFFQHPAKYLLQNRFGIYLNQDKILDEDREPFRLQGLEGYRIGQDLLDRYLNQKSLESYKQVANAADLLPEGWPGEQAFKQKTADVQQFGSNLQEILRQDKLEPLEVDIELGEFRITGKLDRVYTNEQILYRYGSMRPKDLIELWIRHLAFQYVKPESHSGNSRLYTRGKKQPVEFYHLPPISEPADILSDLLRIYWSGLKRNTLFFPEISFAFAHEVCFRNNDPEKGIKSAGYKWKDDYASYPREGDDPYNKLLTGDVNPLDNKDFQSISRSFWEPFFDVLNKGVE